MSNSKINLEGDDRLIPIREEIAGLSVRQIAGIATIPGEIGDKVIQVLDSYEKEIIRLQEINGRLRNKNRNYRTGIKGLQRAHEALLHRHTQVQDTSEQYRELLVQAVEGLPALCTTEVSGPYSPVRFNNEPQPVSAFEAAVAERDRAF